MKERVQTLVKDMASQGLHFAAGEAPVRLEDGEVKSVDVRCWLSSRQTYALLEMKWSRQGLPAALASNGGNLKQQLRAELQSL